MLDAAPLTDRPAPDQPVTDWLDAPTLHGHAVTLEALTEAHAADLAAGADEDTVRFLSRGGPDANTPGAWAGYIRRLNAIPARVNWAVRRLDTGVAVGRISFSEVKPGDRWVEIGTMLLPAAQGVGINPDAKLLLMVRAFEVLGANRVQFKVDARNARSVRAMLKLGAVQEGTLRQYQIRPDGFARDSVMFSVLRSEWSTVKAGLEGRVAAGR
ncbi:GNAT family N-acetyltransferase [Deinococcus sp. KSM4-11]|uniref:GNAT family N-acetyltransferase n=1 Tax=Deinococcus sp. KSM4-11 TaxID=2568654 RepID=UPI0010A525FD|nr:GNAT family protein [Deinococcus sp. KSM4-11]THF87940.1 GNAT family N-acetyltransferase [Deinococcus sp. KSM4-11]